MSRDALLTRHTVTQSLISGGTVLALGHRKMTAQPHRIGINVDHSVHQVVVAENALALTWQRLNALRQAAFYGGRYDSDEYDLAVVSYRAAERSLREARGAWASRRQAPLVVPETEAPHLLAA